MKALGRNPKHQQHPSQRRNWSTTSIFFIAILSRGTQKGAPKARKYPRHWPNGIQDSSINYKIGSSHHQKQRSNLHRIPPRGVTTGSRHREHHRLRGPQINWRSKLAEGD
ncbi:hypothetical protein Nepgr_028335 [Nepenthes gracilis]|uniref:Uncharacterized protein n=1 Tax=Nepenthes gracilis TaxID=150966 RepID=A0AAD3TDH2_NEPGR|nr:hypothetical protein Nepgr_028335 [Nepenthes gracilis]